MSAEPDAASHDRWTLVRNARQLLTLHGRSGARRGSDMANLTIVPHGAVLIRNGVIEDIGPARRVENLAGAKKAREIDATGRIVMPAFVDADMALVIPAPLGKSACGTADESRALRVMSRHRVQTGAAALAGQWARYGCLTVGAYTPCASDVKNISKVLRVHRALQSKPLRVRSIFSPQIPCNGEKSTEQMIETITKKWLPAVRQKKLSSVLEITVGGPPPALNAAMIRTLAIAAVGMGYAVRLRSAVALEPVHLQLALTAGAIAIVAPNDSLRVFAGPLADNGCVRVIPASEGFDDPARAAADMRKAIDEGSAIAISSSYRAQGESSFNMQFLLYLAVHQLGMTAEEAITATTWNAACSLRLSHAAGSLEPGKAADLLVMDVPDYRDLARRAGHHDIDLVMKAGSVLYRCAALSPD